MHLSAIGEVTPGFSIGVFLKIFIFVVLTAKNKDLWQKKHFGQPLQLQAFWFLQ